MAGEGRLTLSSRCVFLPRPTYKAIAWAVGRAARSAGYPSNISFAWLVLPACRSCSEFTVPFIFSVTRITAFPIHRSRPCIICSVVMLMCVCPRPKVEKVWRRPRCQPCWPAQSTSSLFVINITHPYSIEILDFWMSYYGFFALNFSFIFQFHKTVLKLKQNRCFYRDSNSLITFCKNLNDSTDSNDC